MLGPGYHVSQNLTRHECLKSSNSTVFGCSNNWKWPEKRGNKTNNSDHESLSQKKANHGTKSFAIDDILGVNDDAEHANDSILETRSSVIVEFSKLDAMDSALIQQSMYCNTELMNSVFHRLQPSLGFTVDNFNVANLNSLQHGRSLLPQTDPASSLLPFTFTTAAPKKPTPGHVTTPSHHLTPPAWTQQRSKRVRTVFTTEQLERLEQRFERQQYMVGTERFYLASALKLTEAQVKVWFQNRRIKWRKQCTDRQHARAQGTPGVYGAYDVSEEATSSSCSDVSVSDDVGSDDVMDANRFNEF